MLKLCRHCGAPFHAPERWRVYCSKDCWLEAKIATRTAPLLAELEALQEENERLRQALAETGIPEDILRGIRLLCHPDKHGGSALATKVTQWVNAQLQSR